MPLANQQNPPQQLSARGVRNDDEDDEERLDEPGGAGPLFDADTTGGELREIVTQLQLENNTQKRRITELICELDDLHSSQSPRRKRRRAAAQEPTPLDPRYHIAGQRCTLFWMLWVTPDLYEVEIDETYSEERRYQDNEPAMQIQGERQDMLSSMAEGLVQGFNDQEHYRKVFEESLATQRRTTASRVRASGSICFGTSQDQFKNHEYRAANQDFKDLLGYREDEATTSKRWPALAPVLYLDNQTGNAYKAFRSMYIKNVFRACLFGPGSVDGPLRQDAGPKVLADVLSIKSITVGAIAAAATFQVYPLGYLARPTVQTCWPSHWHSMAIRLPAIQEAPDQGA